jgi:hypothetical protein
MKTHVYWTRTAALLAASVLGWASASAALAARTLPDTTGVSTTGVLTGGGGGGGGAPDLGPDDPLSKPRKPGQPYGVSSRTPYSIELEWQDNSSYEQGFVIYRSSAYSGPWTQIATRGPASGNTAKLRYTDAGLPRDTGYYYRIGAYNFYGESFSLPQSFATIDGRQVSRLRLRIRTANVSDADTEDEVNVSLRDQDLGGTWLDYGREDFVRGDEFTYELSLADLFDGIQDLSEINHLYLLKPGDDGWCIESLALIAETRNGVDSGVELFSQTFGSTSATCRWLDDANNYLVIGRGTLRAHPSWQAYSEPTPPLSLHRLDLQKRVEGMVGDIIHDHIYVDLFPLYQGSVDVKWTGSALDGTSHVKVTRRDAQAVRTEFELDVDSPGPGGLTGTLSFDLRFAGRCRTATTPPGVVMTMENVAASADFDFITEAITLWLINFAEDSIAERIKNGFPDFSRQFDVPEQTVSCVTPVVASDGTVDFDLTFVPRTAPPTRVIDRAATVGVLETTDGGSGSSTPTPVKTGTLGTLKTWSVMP